MEPTRTDIKSIGKLVLQIYFFLFAVAVADKYVSTEPPLAVLHETKAGAEETELHCDVTGKPKPKISWSRNDKILKHNGQPVTEAMYTATKSGNYRCIANNSHGTAMSDKVTISIQGFRHWRKHKIRVNLPLDKSHVFVPKNIISIPANSKIIWTIDGYNPLNKNRFLQLENGSLYVTKLKDADTRLECSVYSKNSARSNTCGQFIITTYSGGASQTCLEPVKQVIGMAESDIKLLCTCPGSTAKWTSDIPSFGERKGPILILKNVSHNQAGNYTCTATNDLGGTMSLVRELKVESKPVLTQGPKNQVVNKNEKEVQFYCKGRGIPTPTVQWYINEYKVEEIGAKKSGSSYTLVIGDGVLTIQDLSVDTSMTIHCNLSNTHGYVWSQVSFVVTDKDATPVPVHEPITRKSTTLEPTTPSTTVTTTTKTPVTTFSSTSKILIAITSSSTIHRTTTSTTARPQGTNSSNVALEGAPPSSGNGIKDEGLDTDSYVKVVLPVKYILIGAVVLVILLIIIAIVCTCLCLKYCQKRKEEKQERYPRSNTLSNLSYISQLARIRDFDGESEDSGIDERSVLKSKTSIPRIENQENHKNELDDMIEMDNLDSQPNIMEQHL